MNLNWKHIYVLSYYFFKVRPDPLSFILYRAGFPLFVLFYFNVDLHGMLISFLAWAGFIAIYESAYIDNDYFAVKKEDKPSIRLSADQKEGPVYLFLFAHFSYFCLAILATYFQGDLELAIKVGCAQIFIGLVFFLHNRLQRKNRLITYMILKCSHLVVPVIFIEPLIPVILSVLIAYVAAPLIAYVRKVRNLKVSTLKPNLIAIAVQVGVVLVIAGASHFNQGNFYLRLISVLSSYLIAARLLEIVLRKKVKQFSGIKE